MLKLDPTEVYEQIIGRQAQQIARLEVYIRELERLVQAQEEAEDSNED